MGQAVFVNGAYGGVGQAAVHIAQAMGAFVTGRVGPGALADARAIGIDSVLDYTQEIPASLQREFDIVFDCNGSLSPAEGDMLIKRGGVVVDINPTAYKFVRSLYSLRHRFVFSNQGTDVLQTIADMARSGKLRISIGRTVKLDEAIALIGDLEAGRRAKGKAVIAMP
jgi:NADPH:quinone reductase-like Zn-dependent oxidoreductase